MQNQFLTKIPFLDKHVKECVETLVGTDQPNRKSKFLPPAATPPPPPQQKRPERGMMEEKRDVVGCGNCPKCTAPGLKYCKGCGVVKYCSKECQLENWSKHRPVCAEIAQREMLLAFETHPFDTLFARRLRSHMLSLTENPEWAMYKRALFEIGRLMWKKKGRCLVVIPLHQAFPPEDWQGEELHWGLVLPHVSALAKTEQVAFDQHPEAVRNLVDTYHPRLEIVIEIIYYGPRQRYSKLYAMASSCLKIRRPR